MWAQRNEPTLKARATRGRSPRGGPTPSAPSAASNLTSTAHFRGRTSPPGRCRGGPASSFSSRAPSSEKRGALKQARGREGRPIRRFICGVGERRGASVRPLTRPTAKSGGAKLRPVVVGPGLVFSQKRRCQRANRHGCSGRSRRARDRDDRRDRCVPARTHLTSPRRVELADVKRRDTLAGAPRRASGLVRKPGAGLHRWSGQELASYF